jgi:hypothetical protein
MTIEQTIEVPASRRIVLDVPPQIPAGKTIIAFTPVSVQKAQTASPGRKPISEYFGILSPGTYGNGVAYQRNLRDEWDD